LNSLHRFALRIAALALFVGLAATAAQTSTNDTESARLDEAAATLKQIYATLQQPRLSAADLDKLKEEAQPVGGEVQTVLDELTPRLAALKAQLDQLGPAPGPKASPQSVQVATEREKRQKAYDDVDALMKRANLLAVQAEQANARISQSRRARLTQMLFARESSLASPSLWIAAVSEVPHDLATARTRSADWLSGAAAKLTGLTALAFWAPVALILVLYWPALWISRRGGFRRVKSRSRNRLQKILAVWRVALLVAGLPIAGVAAIGAIATGFGLIDPSEHLPRTVFLGVVRVAVVAGIALGLLAPGQKDRRLPKLDEATCENVLRTALALAILVSASRLVESFADAIDASVTVQNLLRGLGAFLAALVLATALWIRKAPEDQTEESSASRLDSYDWYGLLRIVLWIAVVAILTAVLTGFMNLGRFLVNQIIWVGAVGAVTVMLAVLVEQATRVGFAPRTRFGRSLMLSTGLRRDSFEQLAVLLSGLTRVVIFVIAVMMALAPWGVQSSDVSGYLYAAFFGFKVGTITISLSRIAFALIIFVAGYLVTRTIERWLDVSFLPRTRLDKGLRNAIGTSFGYIGLILALSVALAALGLDFEKLAIVAGALSVGIGFGLQSIVNNFVSGLILLWERAIRVGDWICVGPNEGYVRRINVRSTEIETFDCAAVVIPNTDLVAGVVKNFVRTDRTGRVNISMAVNPAADPEKARDLLLEIAKLHKLVLEKPPPQVNFTSITGSAFNFELYCFIADIATLASVKSDLNFEIYRRFKEENLFAAPPPVLVVNLPEIEKHGIALKRDGAAKEGQSTS
jgi:small-conductance mechanosensitive channel